MATLVHPSLTDCQAFPAQRTAAASQSAMLSHLARTLRRWRRRMRERRELARLEPRELRDLGVSSSDVWHEINQPFWRSSLHR